MKRYLVILLIASLRFSSQAQTPDCLVFGVVKDIGTHEKLISVRAEALDMKWGRYVTAFVNDSGRYELHLGRNGDRIGLVGSTGASTAPHCHYEVMKDGKKIDPGNFFYNDLTPQQYQVVIELASQANQSFD